MFIVLLGSLVLVTRLINDERQVLELRALALYWENKKVKTGKLKGANLVYVMFYR